MVRVSIADDSPFACAAMHRLAKSDPPLCRQSFSQLHVASSIHCICHVERTRDISNSSMANSTRFSTSLGNEQEGCRMMDRRRFIKISTASALASRVTATSLFAEKTPTPMRILILGGTGFTGPYQVKYALSRGHKVTTFNRGKTHPGELPAEVEQLVGDRNGNLDALKNRTMGCGDRQSDNASGVGARRGASAQRKC